MASMPTPGFLPFRGRHFVAAQRWQEQMEQADLAKPITDADLEAVRRWDEGEPARREQAERELAAYRQEKSLQREALLQARQPQHQKSKRKKKAKK